MTREEKSRAIEELTETLNANEIVYLADISELDALKTTALRRQCFKQGITLKVVKNTLLKKAIEQVAGKDYGELPSVLKGNTSLMTADVANAPAKLIKEFRKKADKPILKAAYIEEAVYLGDENVDVLAALKSKNELIADVIGLLQSPPKTVISQLQSGKDLLAGVVKTLGDREN